MDNAIKQRSIVITVDYCGRVDISREHHRIWLDGKRVVLTFAETLVVFALIEAAGLPLSYRKLCDVAHKREGLLLGREGNGHSSTRTMVKRIRRGFALVDPTYDPIYTENGFGYAWNI